MIIIFDEFKNIEYLAKSDFGEVHKATWIDGYWEVVLERIHNSNDKVADILRGKARVYCYHYYYS